MLWTIRSVSVATIPPHIVVTATTGHMRETHGHGCSHETTHGQQVCEFHVLFIYVPRNTILVLIFFNHLKNIKAILSSRAIQNPAAGCTGLWKRGDRNGERGFSIKGTVVFSVDHAYGLSTQKGLETQWFEYSYLETACELCQVI